MHQMRGVSVYVTALVDFVSHQIYLFKKNVEYLKYLQINQYQITL